MPADPTSPVLTGMALQVPGEDPIGTIAICSRDHIAAETAISLMATLTGITALIGGGRLDAVFVQGSVLTMQRNDAAKRMRGEWLLFIDDDMVWQPTDVAQLINDSNDNGLEMVGGLCFRRGHPHQPTLYMRESPSSGAYNFMEKWESDLIEVDATGMAFILIRESVFRKMATARKADWPSWQERIRRQPPEFFAWYGGLGEDLRFCQVAKELGIKIFVDTRIQIGHVAEINVGYRDFVRAVAERTADDEAERLRVNGDMGLPTLTSVEARKILGWTTPTGSSSSSTRRKKRSIST